MSNTKRLTELLEQKHQLLTQIRSLAERQVEVAQNDDPRAMLSLVAAKQGLIDALMNIEKQLAPYRDEDPQQRVWDSQQERARVATISRQCDELLSQVMNLDRQGLQTAQERQQRTKSQIDSAHQAVAARNAYLTNETSSPRRIDLASDA